MELDVRGEICPYPMMKAVEAMKKLQDHAPCLDTIPPQAGRYGYSSNIKKTGSPEWTITLTPIGGE